MSTGDRQFRLDPANSWGTASGKPPLTTSIATALTTLATSGLSAVARYYLLGRSLAPRTLTIRRMLRRTSGLGRRHGRRLAATVYVTLFALP